MLAERLDKILAGTLNLNSVPVDISQNNCAVWNSINHLNLIIALEAEFGVMFEPEEIAEMRSRQIALKLLEQKLN